MLPFKDILLEAMKPGVASTIFAKFGVRNAAVLDKGKLRKYYMALVKQHHPDKGGKDEDMRWINAAYDVLYPVAKDVPDIELKPEDAIVNIRFQILRGEILDSGQCNRSEFLEIVGKIKNDGVSVTIIPPDNYDNINERWLVDIITIFMDAYDFYTMVPILEPLFKH